MARTKNTYMPRSKAIAIMNALATRTDGDDERAVGAPGPYPDPPAERERTGLSMSERDHLLRPPSLPRSAHLLLSTPRPVPVPDARPFIPPVALPVALPLAAHRQGATREAIEAWEDAQAWESVNAWERETTEEDLEERGCDATTYGPKRIRSSLCDRRD